MQLKYRLSITKPESHYVEVRIEGSRSSTDQDLTFFLPAWSPGSYLMREYGKNIRQFQALSKSGVRLYHELSGKSSYTVSWGKNEKHPGFENRETEFTIIYQVYCHELTVRTSHIDSTHAFIHGPSVFMGVLDREILNPELEVVLPNEWSKISTGLKDISPSREVFRFTAADYDELIDAPLEIGCHETDGFLVNNIPHELAFYGKTLPHQQNLKKDIQTIVETVLKTTKDIPYEKYTFMTHFVPQLFGGLEHLNSTALQYCSLKMAERKGYLQWLSLVAHEYFHTWNVKRIRPIELGPFDYLNEAMTRMHWLTEGLTSFMDDLFVLRSGLCTLDEYLDMQKGNLNRYFATPGRKFHSLEDSSYLAWVKLYRPDENSANSSVSYYLKGGLVFFILHKELVDHGSSIDEFIAKLWQRYLENPKQGLIADEVYEIILNLSSKAVLERFQTMVQTTEEIPLEKTWQELGVKFEFEAFSGRAFIGAKWKFDGERVLVEGVELDSPAFSAGLNAGDELITMGDLRVLKSTLPEFETGLKPVSAVPLRVSRLGRLIELTVQTTKYPQTTLKALKCDEPETAKKYLFLKA